MLDKFKVLEKYNFWNNNIPELGITREEYINRISNFVGNKLIKVLVGQRRAGKSYILRQIILKLITDGTNPHNIFYLNKEFTAFDDITDYKKLENLIEVYKQNLNPSGKIYLFIDEIQNIEGWEKIINSYSQSYIEEYEIFITGSNSNMLSGELASLLSGRYIQFLILPFSYNEFIKITNSEKSKKTFLRYIQTGGLPELFHLPDNETKRHYVSAVKDTIILRDIVQRYKIKDIPLLEDIFAFFANNASNLISINNIVRYFTSKKRKTNYETISSYIEYLKNAYLIHEVPRYNIRGKEILASTRKYYLNDLSYKNYLYPGFGYGVGYMLENIVYLQLLNKQYTVYVGILQNKEVDFIAIKDDRVIYIQVAYVLMDEKTIEREYSALESIPDNYEKFVVSLDDIALPSRNGIKHILAWELDAIL